MTPKAIIFDFDGVIIESEYDGNRHLAEYLTSIGHPTSVEESMTRFMGLAREQFYAAIENWIGEPLPDDFQVVRAAENARVMSEGLPAVPGAIAYVRSLPVDLPVAIASSSHRDWLQAHLNDHGLIERFAPHIYSGAEDVKRGKPEPDLYLYAANALGIPIEDCVILEDSPVGVTGALKTGARVIGVIAGAHCLPGHGERLRQLGIREIAPDFDAVARMINL